MLTGENYIIIDCNNISNCNNEAFSAGTSLIIRIDQDNNVETTYVSNFSKSNYTTVMIIVFSIGSIIILVSIIDTVNKIMTFRMVMRAIKIK